MNKFLKAFLLIACWISAQNVNGTSTGYFTEDIDTNLVYIFDINEDIMPAMLRVTQQAFEEANRINADYIIIRMNTYGGMVNIADSIRTRILNCKIPVYVYIENNAASAGALISIAANKIYMKNGARIGAASVVNQTGEVMPEKYQSYMRSTMRATAESHGKDTIITSEGDTILKWKRDPNIAEAMVDPKIYIKGVSDTGDIVTFTAQEALEHGFCEGIAESVHDVFKQADIDNPTIVEFKPSAMDKLIGLLSHPALQGILIMIIVGGIYFELQTPGIGFPIAASVIAAVLYFAPLYIEGLAENWEMVLFFVGLILIGVELFAIPGFGVAGILGILAMISGLVLAMVDNVVFDFRFHADLAIVALLKAMALVTFSMFASLLISIYLSKKLLTSHALSTFVLNSKEDLSDGYIGVDNQLKELVGKKGIATTVLRPSGKVEIENDIYEAKSEIGFIDKGEKIKVLSFTTNQLNVIKES